MDELLTGLFGEAYTEEARQKVKEALEGQYVPAADHAAVVAERDRMGEQIDTMTGQLDDFQQSAGDNAELQSTITALQDELRQSTITRAAVVALAQADVEDVEVGLTLLSGFLGTAEMDRDGKTVKGLQEAVDGVGVADIKLPLDAKGKIDSGKWVDPAGAEHDMTIELKGPELCRTQSLTQKVLTRKPLGTWWAGSLCYGL